MNPTCSCLPQIMDLPEDVWGIVSQHIDGRDWGKACGTSRASYAMKRHLVMANLHSEQSAVSHECGAKQVSMEQLRLDKWHRCHSLWVNSSRLLEGTELTQSQIDKIKKASEALPLLRCLHIIGRNYPYEATESSFELVLIDILAKRASVLTLKVLPKMVTRAFDLPTVQHLVLEVTAFRPQSFHPSQDYRQIYRNPFAAVCGLRNLKTLYVHYHRFMDIPIYINGVVDLATCVLLQYVTLRNVTFEGELILTACIGLQHVTLHDVSFKGNLVLPKGCPLHVASGRKFLRENIGACAKLVTGLSLHNAPSWELHTRACAPDNNHLLQHAPHMQNLKRLRVKLGKEYFYDRYTLTRREKKEVHLVIDYVPSLEELKLEMECDLFICMEFAHALTSLVIITTGILRLAQRPPNYETEILPAPKQLYLQSGAALTRNYRGEFHEPYILEPWTGMTLMDIVKVRHDGWTAQMPSTFQPSNLKQCGCGACPACLAQAGVPILCEEAWTADGFQADVMHMSRLERLRWLRHHGKLATSCR